MAVIIAHGMGQQVPFETLEEVALALHRQEKEKCRQPPILVRRTCPDRPKSKASSGTSDTAADAAGPVDLQDLPRAEVFLNGKQGRVTVHLFEMYWAPLTEGKASLMATFMFLIRAGWSGMRNAGDGYSRLVFNKWTQVRANHGTLKSLALTSSVVLSLMSTIAVLSGVVGARTLGSTSGVTPSLIADLTLAWVVFLAGVMFLLIGTRLPSGLNRIRWALVWVGILVVAVNWLVLLVLILGHVSYRFSPVVPLPILIDLTNHVAAGRLTWISGIAAVVWVLVVISSLGVRYFVQQFVGDVAAYISSHTVNAFYQVRQDIQNASRKVARAVYAARREDKHRYERIIVMGHSLGSIIAYDTLNSIIREDLLGANWNAANRTSHLFTYGSPMDKIAYIFRTQRPSDAPVREALAGSVQPLIDDMKLRPRRWINIHSPADIISGDINYYGPSIPPPPGQPQPTTLDGVVENINDEDNDAPLRAHSNYWKGCLPARLYQAVIGD